MINRTQFSIAIACAMGVVAAPVIAQEARSSSGLYLGVDSGLGWTRMNTTMSPFGSMAISDFAPMSGNTHGDGAIFGVHIGYNWHFDKLLLGLEASLGQAGISGTG